MIDGYGALVELQLSRDKLTPGSLYSPEIPGGLSWNCTHGIIVIICRLTTTYIILWFELTLCLYGYNYKEIGIIIYDMSLERPRNN